MRTAVEGFEGVLEPGGPGRQPRMGGSADRMRHSRDPPRTIQGFGSAVDPGYHCRQTYVTNRPHAPPQRPHRFPRAPRRRGRHASLRQSGHDRARDHGGRARLFAAQVRPRPAGSDRDRDGGRLRARLGPARRGERPRRAGPRQRDGCALQREVLQLADHPHRRPAGAGPRPARAAALRAAGADRAAAGQVGGRGDARRGPAAHPAARGEGRAHAADRAGVRQPARRRPRAVGRHRPRPAGARRCEGAADRRSPRTARRTARSPRAIR